MTCHADESVGTLYTFLEYHRTIPCLIAASYSKAKLTINTDGPPSSSKDPHAEIQKKLFSEVPVFISKVGNTHLYDSNSISYFLSSEQLKGGDDLKSQCSVLQWTYWAERELVPLAEACTFTKLGVKVDDDIHCKTILKAKEEVMKCLKYLNEYLLKKSFFVGERITLADIIIFSSCFILFKLAITESESKTLKNLVRWFNTIINQPEVHKAMGEGAIEFKFCTVDITSKSPKIEQSKDIAKESTEESVPKPKNPLAALPKGTFSIDDFKKVYCNQDTEKVAIPHFWEKFDAENYSIWFSEYKFPEELKMTFMTSNLVSGMFQRLDSLRNHAFASVCIFGENGNNTIGGIWLWRGDKLAFELCEDWNIDYESYDWKKLDPSKPEVKELVNEYLLWTPKEFKGKKLYEGKIFK